MLEIRATPLFASFERMFGGPGLVPSTVTSPASHFQRVPRLGQYATIVAVTSRDGLIGHGEAFGLPHPAAAAALIDHVVAPALRGVDLRSADGVLEALSTYFVALGHSRGAAMEALSGVDIALWDLRARYAEQPLAVHLGGALRPVPLYGSPIPLLATPDQSAEEARAFLRRGFVAMKLKIGRGVTRDLAHIEAVCDALGPGHSLMLDANCAYDVDTAIELARGLKRFAVAWLEEPVAPGDARELAAVRRASPVPIAAGENEFTLPAFAALIEADAVDVLQPNITRAGGVTGFLRIAALCDGRKVRLAPHGVGGCVGVAAAVHACCAAPSVWCYEANRLPNPLRDELALFPLELEDGALRPAPRPGHGGEPDPRLVEAYAWRAIEPASPREAVGAAAASA